MLQFYLFLSFQIISEAKKMVESWLNNKVGIFVIFEEFPFESTKKISVLDSRQLRELSLLTPKGWEKSALWLTLFNPPVFYPRLLLLQMLH